MDPPFQRKGKQWTVGQKAYLIDSILNGYDIPKFYFADFSLIDTSLSTGPYDFAVIDGKQRLEAISEFASGDLMLDRNFVLIDGPDVQVAGWSYRQLSQELPEVADRFDNFMLNVVVVVTDDEARINDLFVRLNSGTGLSGAQVRNAMQGAWLEAIREVASHQVFTDVVAFSTRQGQDLNVAAKLLMLEFRGAVQDTKKKNLDRFITTDPSMPAEPILAEAGEGGIQRTVERTLGVLDRLATIFQRRDALLRSQGPLVVYYWLLRRLDSSEDGRFREVVASFEKRRLQNREAVKATGEQGAAVDRSLVAFDIARRNANDARSIETMVETLEREFQRGPHGQDHTVGRLELLAVGEAALSELVSIQSELSERIDQLTRIAVEATPRLEQAGTFAGKLEEAERLAAYMEPVTLHIDELASTYLARVREVDPMIGTLAELLRREPEGLGSAHAKEFAGAVMGLSSIIASSNRAYREAIPGIRDLRQWSSGLRPPSERVERALTTMLRANEVMLGWPSVLAPG